MESLKYLYLSDPFICDCKLQWTSQVEQLGYTYDIQFVWIHQVTFRGQSQIKVSIQIAPKQAHFNVLVNRLLVPAFKYVITRILSYFCGCPKGYVLPSSGQCIDANECNEATNCQHTCANTEGSFYCTCNEGYELASDGYSCDDVNECLELNGGCEFGCLNNKGSVSVSMSLRS